MLSFFQGMFTFYHQGHELSKDFNHYKMELQINIQNVRKLNLFGFKKKKKMFGMCIFHILGVRKALKQDQADLLVLRTWGSVAPWWSAPAMTNCSSAN
jgi:hypothetical protein